MPEISRQIKLGLAAGVLALLLIFGFAYYFQRSGDGAPRISNNAERNLSEEDRQVLEGEVAGLEVEATNLESYPPDSVDQYRVFTSLAQVKFDLGRNEEAIAALDRIAEEFPDRARIWGLYGLIYLEEGEVELGLERIRRAIELDGDNEDYWLVYIELNKMQGAENMDSVYEQALSATENSTDIIAGYALYLEEEGQKDRAIEQWQKAIQEDQENQTRYEQEIQRIQNS